MAAPTQEMPPWLTYSTTTLTDTAGLPLTTSTTLIYLPLTYYGPSIPLGSLWTYGGLTSPESTATTPSATPTPTTATPTSFSSVSPISSSSSTSSTSIISSASSLSSSSLTSASTSSITSVTNSLPSSITSAISTSTPSVTSEFPSTSSGVVPTVAPSPSQSGGLSRGQIIGIVVASVLSLIALFVLGICIYINRKARRRRARSDSDVIDSDFVIVNPSPHTPGEGSPRGSGEEHDTLLQPNTNANAGTSAAAAAAAALAATSARAPGPSRSRRVPPPPVVPDGSVSSSSKSSSNASGYGTVLDRPTISVSSPPPEQRVGNILTPAQLKHIEQETVLPPPPLPANTDFGPSMQEREHDSATSPTSPDFVLGSSRLRPVPSRASHRSSYLADVGDAQILTARRVAVDSPKRDSWLGILGGLFSSESKKPNSRREAAVPGWTARGLSDHDVEAGRALLGEQADEYGIRHVSADLAPTMSERPVQRGLLVNTSGSRPYSQASGHSAGSITSIYHDALSFLLPAVPAQAVYSPPHSPPHSPPTEINAWPSLDDYPPLPESQTPSAQSTLSQGRSLTNTQATVTTVTAAGTTDILDLPAPKGISPFASSSSLRGSSTTDFGEKAAFPHPPPGLTYMRHGAGTPPKIALPAPIPTPGVWQRTGGDTPSPGSFAGTAGQRTSVTIDVLESDPPPVREGWRSLGGGGSGMGTRTTFGLPVYMDSPDVTSEQGSLHSMRSLGPQSHSTGSVAASHRDLSGSGGSNSSRPSGYTGTSHSLSHSGSISSDGRRNRFSVAPISPALSAVGHHRALYAPVPQRPGEGQLPVSPPLSPLPWAGGLERDWVPN